MEKLSIAIEEWECYNNSILLIKWFDQDTDIEDIKEYVRSVKKENGLNHEDLEMFAADWENDFLNLCSEHCNIEDVFEKYNELDIDEDKKEVLEYLIDNQGYSVDQAIEKLDDVCVYDCNRFKELAEEFLEQGMLGEAVTELWEVNCHYVDLDAIASDLENDYTEYEGKIYSHV